MSGGSDQDQGATSPLLTSLLTNNGQGQRSPFVTTPALPSFLTSFETSPGTDPQLVCDPAEVKSTTNDLEGDAKTLEPYVDLPPVASKAFGDSPLAQELDALSTQAHGHMRGALSTLTGVLRGYANAAHSAHQTLKDADESNEQQFRTAVNRLTSTTDTALAGTDDASKKAIDAARQAQQQQQACAAPPAGPTLPEGQ